MHTSELAGREDIAHMAGGAELDSGPIKHALCSAKQPFPPGSSSPYDYHLLSHRYLHGAFASCECEG